MGSALDSLIAQHQGAAPGGGGGALDALIASHPASTTPPSVPLTTQAINAGKQVYDFFRHPIQSAESLGKSIATSAYAGFAAPVEGERRAESDYLRGKGIDVPNVAAPGETITKANTPGAVSKSAMRSGELNTAVNVGFGTAPALAAPARIAANAVLGATADPEQRLRGALAGATIGEVFHAPKGIADLADVSSGVSDAIREGAKEGVGELSDDARLWGPNRRPVYTLPMRQRPPVELGPDVLPASAGGEPESALDKLISTRQYLAARGRLPVDDQVGRRPVETLPMAQRPPVAPGPEVETQSFGTTPLTDLTPEQQVVRARLAQEYGVKPDAVGDIGRRAMNVPLPIEAGPEAATQSFGGRVRRRPGGAVPTPEALPDAPATAVTPEPAPTPSRLVAPAAEPQPTTGPLSGRFGLPLRSVSLGMPPESSPQIPEVAALQQIHALARQPDQPLFVRWSEGHETDVAHGERSRNGSQTNLEGGLSAVPIDPTDDMATIAHRLLEYGFTRMHGDRSPYLVTGEIVGLDSDGYPVLRNTRKVGAVPPALVTALDNGLREALDLHREITGSAARLPNLTDRFAIKLTERDLAKNRQSLAAIYQKRPELQAIVEGLHGPLEQDLGGAGESSRPPPAVAEDTPALRPPVEPPEQVTTVSVGGPPESLLQPVVSANGTFEARPGILRSVNAELGGTGPEATPPFRAIFDEKDLGTAPPPPELPGTSRNVPAEELINQHTLDTDPLGTKELQAEVERLKAQGLDKQRVSFETQRQAAQDFADHLNVDRLALDPAKYSRLSGAEIVGLKNVLTKNLNMAGELSRQLADPDLAVGEAETIGDRIDKLRDQNEALLSKIVKETSEKGRDLGFLRQLSNGTLDPDAWIVTAKRMAGDKILSDEQIAMVRKLANEAADACGAGGA